MKSAVQIIAGLTLGLATAGLSGSPTRAQGVPSAISSASTPIDNPAQFYVLSFTDQPIAEVAEEVIGGGLSQTVSVDPAIDDIMSFQVQGAFTTDALLAEFGEALLDRDAALVRSSQGDLAVVLRANLANEIAKGAHLVAVSAPAPQAPRATAVATGPTPAITYGKDRWQDGPLGALLLFFSGALAGAAGLRGGQILRARRASREPVLLMITHDAPSSETSQVEDTDLTIPRFTSSRLP